MLCPLSKLALEAGSYIRPDGALGGDGAPACATISSEQDDFVEVLLVPPGGGLGDRESTLHG